MISVFKKIIIWLVAVAFAAFIALFSLANRTPVELDLWPLALSQELPVFALMLICLAIGIFWGGFAAWLSAGTARKRARDATRRADASDVDLRLSEERNSRLENDLKELRAQSKINRDTIETSSSNRQLAAPSNTDAAA